MADLAAGSVATAGGAAAVVLFGAGAPVPLDLAKEGRGVVVWDCHHSCGR